jgi:hypothetical protein
MIAFPLFILISAQITYSAESYYHLGPSNRPDNFQQSDPYGINQPFTFEQNPSEVKPYQDFWYPQAAPYRIPSNDQNTIEPYQPGYPGVIRNW